MVFCYGLTVITLLTLSNRRCAPTNLAKKAVSETYLDFYPLVANRVIKPVSYQILLVGQVTLNI